MAEICVCGDEPYEFHKMWRVVTSAFPVVKPVNYCNGRHDHGIIFASLNTSVKGSSRPSVVYFFVPFVGV
jgi:hypothetical protein